MIENQVLLSRSMPESPGGIEGAFGEIKLFP